MLHATRHRPVWLNIEAGNILDSKLITVMFTSLYEILSMLEIVGVLVVNY